MVLASTKLTTVRIPNSLYSVIQGEAKAEGVGFNTVLTRILRKYVEWDRAAEKLVMLSVTREAMKILTGMLDETQIDEMANKYAPPIMKELAEFWFMSSATDPQIQMLERFCKYGGLGKLMISKSDDETKFHLRHGLGKNASKMFAGLFGNLFESTNPRIQVEENSLSISMRNASKRKKK